MAECNDKIQTHRCVTAVMVAPRFATLLNPLFFPLTHKIELYCVVLVDTHTPASSTF